MSAQPPVQTTNSAWSLACSSRTPKDSGHLDLGTVGLDRLRPTGPLVAPREWSHAGGSFPFGSHPFQPARQFVQVDLVVHTDILHGLTAHRRVAHCARHERIFGGVHALQTSGKATAPSGDSTHTDRCPRGRAGSRSTAAEPRATSCRPGLMGAQGLRLGVVANQSVLLGKSCRESRSLLSSAPHHREVDGVADSVCHEWSVRPWRVLVCVVRDVRPSLKKRLDVGADGWGRLGLGFPCFHAFHHLLVNQRRVGVRSWTCPHPDGQVVAHEGNNFRCASWPACHRHDRSAADPDVQRCPNAS